MTKDSYGYPTKIPTKITDLYGGNDIPSRDEIPTSDDIVEEIEEYLDVDLATEGQVLTMGADGIVEWDDVASGGSLNYSTEEQDTGRKWIDGKEIYCRTYDVAHRTSESSILIRANSTDINLINVEGFIYSTSTGSGAPKYTSFGYKSNTEYSYISKNEPSQNIYNNFGTSSSPYANSNYHTVATLYYTKNEV